MLESLHNGLGDVISSTADLDCSDLVFQSFGKNTKETKLVDRFNVNYISDLYEIRAALKTLVLLRREIISQLLLHGYEAEKAEQIATSSTYLSFGHDTMGYDHWLYLMIPTRYVNLLRDCWFYAELVATKSLEITGRLYHLIAIAGEVKAYNGRTKGPTRFRSISKLDIRNYVNLPNTIKDRTKKIKNDLYSWRKFAAYIGGDDIPTVQSLLLHIMAYQEMRLFDHMDYHSMVNYPYLSKIRGKNAGEFGFVTTNQDGVKFFKLTFAEMKRLHQIIDHSSTIDQVRQDFKRYFDSFEEQVKGLWTDRSKKIGNGRRVAGVWKAIDRMIATLPGGRLVDTSDNIRLERTTLSKLLVTIDKLECKRKIGSESVRLTIPGSNYYIDFTVNHDHFIRGSKREDPIYVSALKQIWTDKTLLQAVGKPIEDRYTRWKLHAKDENGKVQEIMIESDLPITRKTLLIRLEFILFGFSVDGINSLTYYHRGNYRLKSSLRRLDKMGRTRVVRSAFFGNDNGRSANKRIERALDIDYSDVPDLTVILHDFLVEQEIEGYEAAKQQITNTELDKGSGRLIKTTMDIDQFWVFYFQGYRSRNLLNNLPFFIVLDAISQALYNNPDERITFSGMWRYMKGKNVKEKLFPQVLELGKINTSNVKELIYQILNPSFEHIISGHINTGRNYGPYSNIDNIIEFLKLLNYNQQDAGRIVAKELVKTQLDILASKLIKRAEKVKSENEKVNMFYFGTEVITSAIIESDLNLTQQELENIIGAQRFGNILTTFVEKVLPKCYDKKKKEVSLEVIYGRWKKKKVVRLKMEEFLDEYLRNRTTRKPLTKRPFFMVLDEVMKLLPCDNRKVQSISGVLSTMRGSKYRKEIIPVLEQKHFQSPFEALVFVINQFSKLIVKIQSYSDEFEIKTGSMNLLKLLYFLKSQGIELERSKYILLHELLYFQIPAYLSDHYNPSNS